MKEYFSETQAFIVMTIMFFGIKVLVLPPDTMTLNKESLFIYGLTYPGSLFDNGIHKPASLNRTVNPKEADTVLLMGLHPKGKISFLASTAKKFIAEGLT